MRGDISTASNIIATINGYGVLGGQLSGSGTISGSLTMCEPITAAIGSESGTYTLVDSDGNYITDSGGNIITGRTRASRISGDMSAAASISGSISIPSAIGGDPYTGEYTIEPTRSTQVLATYSKVMTDDLVIRPIPENYGLITWDGSTLTVS